MHSHSLEEAGRKRRRRGWQWSCRDENL